MTFSDNRTMQWSHTFFCIIILTRLLPLSSLETHNVDAAVVKRVHLIQVFHVVDNDMYMYIHEATSKFVV